MRIITRIVAAIAPPLIIAAGTISGASAVTTPAGLTANQIASRANADLKAATTFHVWGQVTEGGSRGSINITHGSNGCEGTFTFGSTSVSFVQIGSTTWLEVEGQWTQTPTSENKDTLELCNPRTVAGLVDVTVGLTKGPVTTISHRRALELRDGSVAAIYVTTGAKPEYVRLVVAGHEQLNFSGINASVTISPPPAS
jgi:hypothetical protein